jgi:hypothetical protein
MKHLVPILLCWICSCAVPAFAGKDQQASYDEAAARVKAEMAALPFPELALRKVPEKYRNESQVLLADYTAIQAGVLPGSKRGWITYRTVSRMIVALQDEAAIRAWSDGTYGQFSARNTGFGMLKTRAFVGVRVFKADGSVSEINPDEDELSRKYSIGQGMRLAIPNLQTGDILDYYLVNEWDGEPANFGVNSYQYFLNSATPTLNRRIECETGPDFAIEFHNINGAPAFDTISLGDKHWKLRYFSDSVQHIRPGIPFVNAKREYPLLQLNVMRGDIPPYTSLTRRKPGMLYINPEQDRFLWDEMVNLSRVKMGILNLGAQLVSRKSKGVAAFYDSLMKSGGNFALDTFAANVYYMYRFDYLFNSANIWGARTIANLNHAIFDADVFHYLLSEYFKIHNLKADVVIASPLSEPPLKDVIDRRDYMLMTAVRGSHNVLFGAPHIYAPAFSTLRQIEGVPDAIAVDTKGAHAVLGASYETRPIAIPFTDASDNVRDEQFSLLPDPDCSGIRIARTTRLTGHCKDGVQDRMLTIEDFYNYERQFYNDTRSLEERVLDRKDPGTMAAELKSELEKLREDQHKRFESEAKLFVYPELTELQQATIRNPGTRHTDPEFQFSSRFRANGLLRPAGNNFILQIGELVRNLPDVRPEQYTHKETVYLNFANTYRSSYTIRIPEGFSVAGVDALNKAVSNEFGQFEVKASQDDKLITISLEFTCKETMYSPAEWTKLANVFDAANAWKGSRILFRRAS